MCYWFRRCCEWHVAAQARKVTFLPRYTTRADTDTELPSSSMEVVSSVLVERHFDGLLGRVAVSSEAGLLVGTVSCARVCSASGWWRAASWRRAWASRLLLCTARPRSAGVLPLPTFTSARVCVLRPTLTAAARALWHDSVHRASPRLQYVWPHLPPRTCASLDAAAVLAVAPVQGDWLRIHAHLTHSCVSRTASDAPWPADWQQRVASVNRRCVGGVAVVGVYSFYRDAAAASQQFAAALPALAAQLHRDSARASRLDAPLTCAVALAVSVKTPR